MGADLSFLKRFSFNKLSYRRVTNFSAGACLLCKCFCVLLWINLCDGCLIKGAFTLKTKGVKHKPLVCFSNRLRLYCSQRENPLFLIFPAVVCAGHQRTRLCDGEAHQPGRNPRTYLCYGSGSFPWHRELHSRGVLHEHAGPDSRLPGQDLHRAGTNTIAHGEFVLTQNIWPCRGDESRTVPHRFSPSEDFQCSFGSTMRGFKTRLNWSRAICSPPGPNLLKPSRHADLRVIKILFLFIIKWWDRTRLEQKSVF